MKEIAINGVEEMSKNYGSNPRDILVCLGPSISKDDFEVEKDVLFAYGEVFIAEEMEKLFQYKSPGKFLIDPVLAITYQLLNAGVLMKNIEVSKFTTMGDNDLFSSARKAGGFENVDSSFFVLYLK